MLDSIESKMEAILAELGVTELDMAPKGEELEKKE